MCVPIPDPEHEPEATEPFKRRGCVAATLLARRAERVLLALLLPVRSQIATTTVLLNLCIVAGYALLLYASSLRRDRCKAGRNNASWSCCSVSVANWPGQSGDTRPLTS